MDKSHEENDDKDWDGNMVLAHLKQTVAGKTQTNGFSRPNSKTERTKKNKPVLKPKKASKPFKENKKKMIGVEIKMTVSHDSTFGTLCKQLAEMNVILLDNQMVIIGKRSESWKTSI